MGVITVQVGASGDGGVWAEGNSWFSTTSNGLYAGGYYDGTYGVLNSFARFDNITIPQGATIRVAYLILTCRTSGSLNTVNAIISAIDADDAAAPTTYAGAETATRTTATVAWNAITAWTADTAYNSPSIVDVIQEIVDRGSWVSGNAIVVYMEDNGSTTTNGTYRYAQDYDGSAVKAAQLYIEYGDVDDISDSGAGSESVLLDKSLGIADSGTGSESVAVSRPFSIADSGSGTEAVYVDHDFGLSDTGTGTETVAVDKSLVLTDSGSGIDSVVDSKGDYTEVLNHPHTAKMYLAVKVPRIVWKGRVTNDRGYNQSGDIEADLLININSGANESGFDVTNFMPDLTVYIGTSDEGSEHGKCRARAFSGANLKVGADMNCIWKAGDYVSITDLHELWPMPHEVTEGDSVTVYKDYDLSAATYKDQYPVCVMGPSACAFINAGTGKATVRFNAAPSYLVQPNSDEIYWTTAGGISAYSWWFEGADTTSSSISNPTAYYSTAGQYVVSLNLTGENGKTFKSFRNIFIYDDDNPPLTDFSIRSMSGSLDDNGWEASIEVFGDAFNPTNLPDKAEVVLFAEEWFNGTAASFSIGHAGIHHRENIKLVGYVSDTSVNYASGKIRSATMTIYGLQKYLKEKTNFPVYVTQIEDSAPDWSYFSNGLTVRLALYHLVRWHWTLLRFADFLIPDDHNNYFPGQSWAEGSLADQLSAFCPDIQAEWAVDKTGALHIFSWPNYLPVSGDGAGWRTRLYNDISLTHVDFCELDVAHRVKYQLSRVRVEGVYATASEYWTSVDTAPGNVRNNAGGSKLVSNQILGTGGFVGSQGEELARMVYAEESRRYESITLDLCGNYSFFDIVPNASYFKLTAQPSTLRGVSWSNKPFWVKSMNMSYDHENGDIDVSVKAVPETFPDPDLNIYSQYDEIGESTTSMPSGGGYAAAQLIQEIDSPKSTWIPALMGDGGSQVEGTQAGTSFVRLYGDANQAVIAENRLLADFADRPVWVEVTTDSRTNKPSFRIAAARINNDTSASAVTNRAFTTRYASFSMTGIVTVMTNATPILPLGLYLPKAKIIGFYGIATIGGSGATVQLLKNGGLLSEINIPAGVGYVSTSAVVDSTIVTGDYLSVQVTAASGCYGLNVAAEILVYGV